jgi:transposase
MDVVYAQCAGVDVHKRTVVATVALSQPDGTVWRETRTFATMTADLLALGDWLSALGVQQAAMESTGVFWRPVYTLLEPLVAIWLVNPQHLRAVPGRKTDVKDSEWLADLLRHGLLTASFIPPAPIRALRDLTRQRKTLVEQRAQVVNRVQQVLETANIKLAAVATDVLGRSGRAMLEALVAGEQDPEALAELARGRLRAKLPALRQALEGRVQAHHRFLLEQDLTLIEVLESLLEQVQVEIARQLDQQELVAEAVALATELPGIAQTTAVGILAEIGPDLTRFPSHKHLASWAGMCPGNKQSGGRRLSGKTRHGNPRLRALLCEAAEAISHTTNNYFAALFHRLVRRRGRQKAIVAVGHSLLVTLYHMLRDHQHYHDLGADYFAKQDATRLERHFVRRLEQLGYGVTLTPIPAA